MSKLTEIKKDLEDEIDLAFDDLETGDLSKVEFENTMLGLLTAYISAAYMVGANTDNIDPKYIEPLVERQAGYLNPFITSMLVADGIDSSWRNRAKLYSGSVLSAYWRGQREGLPAYPGEGSECMQNCHCRWNIIGNDAYWELGIGDNCPTCMDRNKKWYPYIIA